MISRDAFPFAIIVTLLPDREPETAQVWPTISVVAGDRGGEHCEAAIKALLNAMQAADHWHPMENAGRAFLDAVRKSMRQIRTAIGAIAIDRKVLTAAERLQHEGKWDLPRLDRPGLRTTHGLR